VAAFGIVPAILGQTKVAYVTKFTSVPASDWIFPS
jgi:hypothetical protein